MLQLSAAASRRLVLAGGLILATAPKVAIGAPRNLSFAVFRNGARIGEHHVAFAGDEAALTATTEATMTVRLGPVPIYRYRHHAVETRRDDVFASLETATSSNGKKEHVVAERTGSGVRIDCASGRATLPSGANPMNHWDQTIFGGPMFNPQTGRLLKVSATRAGAGHWRVRGEVQIDDFYDPEGGWLSLKGKLDDRSTIEYRRL